MYHMGVHASLSLGPGGDFPRLTGDPPQRENVERCVPRVELNSI